MEWCAVWKGSVKGCLDHLCCKHDGDQFLAMKNLGKVSPCGLSRDFCAALWPDVSGMAVDIKLFHESGCQLLHRYRIYGDPLPHLALRGGVIKKFLAFVNWAMAIAQLTPSSGTEWTSAIIP